MYQNCKHGNYFRKFESIYFRDYKTIGINYMQKDRDQKPLAKFIMSINMNTFGNFCLRTLSIFPLRTSSIPMCSCLFIQLLTKYRRTLRVMGVLLWLLNHDLHVSDWPMEQTHSIIIDLTKNPTLIFCL